MGLWGVGSFLGGLVAVIAAVIIHDHAAYPNMLCNTGFGVLGQEFDNTVRVDCGVATTAESLVGWLVALGVLGIAGGLGKMVLGLAGGIVAPAQPSGRNRPSAAAGQAPYGYAAPGQAPYGYAAPAAMPTSVPRPATPPAGPVMPERPATWAPPPPPPGSGSPFPPEA